MPRGRQPVTAKGAAAVRGGRRGTAHAVGGSSASSGGAGSGSERVTRSSKARLTNGLEDPAQVEKELNAQLRSMGLYAANITGDGNCLFRALSDQLYGYPHQHAELRQNVCDYLQAQPDKFAGFIDVEKPFEEYVRSMRQSGTYGGHLELSAFAQLKQKVIKIVQPGLVYVVAAWGDDETPQAARERERKESERERAQARSVPGAEGPPLTQRALRKLRREKKGVGTGFSTDKAAEANLLAQDATIGSSADAACSTESVDEVDQQTALASSSSHDAPQQTQALEAHGPLWIAYHNWEHYSSIRNLVGPHSGLPRIKEKIAGRTTDARGNTEVANNIVDNETNPEPTEEEELVLRSTRGYSLQQIRFYIKRHGGWEEALEAILAQEAVQDDENGGEDASVDAPEPIGRRASDDVNRQKSQPASMPSTGSPEERSALSHYVGLTSAVHEGMRNSPVPDRLREWRNASPSSVDTSGTQSSVEGASTSTHATTDDAGEVPSGPSLGQKIRRSKRTASRDPTSSLRSPKRRSRSRSPLQQSAVANTDTRNQPSTDPEGTIAAHAIANISVDGDKGSRSSPQGARESSTAKAYEPDSLTGGRAEDPERTPRARITSPRGAGAATAAKASTTPRPATQTLSMRERREMRKAAQVQRAMDAKRKREQRRAGGANSKGAGGDEAADDDDGFVDVDDENSGRRNRGSTAGADAGAVKGHGAHVRNFLELKI